MSTSFESVGELASKYLRRQSRRMEALTDKAATGDSEAIHDLRVAIRRSRSLIRVLRQSLTHPLPRRASKKLRFSAQLLGILRDEEVFVSLVRPLSGFEEEHVAKAIEMSDAKRTAALEQLREYLLSSKWKGTMSDMREAAREVGEDVGLTLGEFAPVAVWAQLSKVRSLADRFTELDEQQLHALRIETKRLRYLLEFLSVTTRKHLDPLIESLIRLQDLLGQAHDLALARHRMGIEYESLLQQEQGYLHQAEQLVLLELSGPFRRSLAAITASW